MKTELLGQEKNVVRVKVEFEAEEFTSGLNATIQEIAQKANFPGFRKGRTPRRVIEMRVGRNKLYTETLEKLIPNAVDQVVGDYDLDTIAPPNLKIDAIQEGQPLFCELTFEVLPEVALPELGDIEVRKLIPKVTDELLDEAVKGLRIRHSTLAPIDRPAGEENVVSVKYVTETVSQNEEPPIRGAQQKNDIDLASAIRPEVRDALLGRSKGETAESEFDVDETCEDKSVAGKRIHYYFTVEEVKEKVLPEMTREFYQQALGVPLDSEEAFREEVGKRILAKLESDSAEYARNAALEEIAVRSGLEIPETLVNRQVDLLKEQDAADAKRRFDKDVEEILRLSSTSPAAYEQSLREKAKALVRHTLVLDEISKKFDVEVTKEDLDREILRRATLHGVDPVKLQAALYREKDRMAQVERELRYEKIMQLIMEKVKIRDVDELSSAEEVSAGELPAREESAAPTESEGE
ncbi:MAG: trigger factor [Synergistaceae bacterium]|jgi:trigger factor|nr:trigger factor [Synergistaceae bacterium]